GSLVLGFHSISLILAVAGVGLLSGKDPRITDIKFVLTQKAFDIFCQKFHIPEDVHPQLPSPIHTIHEMPVGKIAAKVSHFEIFCRVHNIEPTVGLFRCFYVNTKNKGWASFSKRPDSDVVCYTKPLDSLKHWNDHFFWVDSFSCPASFPWHTDKNVFKDPFPNSTEFDPDHYAVLVAHPAPFWKFLKPFLCLVGMSRCYTLDEETYLRFLHDDGIGGCLSLYIVYPVVRIVKRERAEGGSEAFGFYRRHGTGDSAAGGGHDVEIGFVTAAEDTATGSVATERPKRPHKKRPAVTDASGSSHPPKKLRGDYGISSEVVIGVNVTRLRFHGYLLLPRLFLPRVSITDIKFVLTRKAFYIFCQKFHIPEDVHPQLPSPNHTIHEMPVGKIAAKVSHFEIFCRVHNIEPTVGLFRCIYVNSKNKGWASFSKRPDSDVVCYTKHLDSLKHWNDHFFWVDSFSCPASFPWHTDKNVFKDPFPNSTEFDPDHYAVLVAHPALFWKFLKPFLCLVGMSRCYTLDEETYLRFLHDDGTEMDLLAFIHVVDPTKVRIVKRERAEGGSEAFGFYRRHGTGDSAAGGGHDVEIEFVTAAEDTATGSVVTERPKGPRKKRPAVTDASGSSHPPKKLRGDYGISSEVVIGGTIGILSAEAGVLAMPTLPFVTSFMSATPRREDGTPFDSVTGSNLRTVGPAIRSVVPPPVTIEAVITTRIYSADTIKPDAAGPSHPSGKEFSLESREVDSENLHEVFVLHWNVPNDALLDDFDTSREFIDHLASSVLFTQIRNMDYEKLFMEFIVGTVRQACLSADEIENLKAQLFLMEAEAAEAAHLRTQVYAIEAAEKVTELRSLVSAKDRVLFPRVGSTTLDNKVIVTLNKFKATMRETLLKGLHQRLCGN
nr:hypothetical protein [Tanacetum cinerariifolium]